MSADHDREAGPEQAAGCRRGAARGCGLPANREDLEPLLLLVADVLALAALAPGRCGKPAEAGKTGGVAP